MTDRRKMPTRVKIAFTIVALALVPFIVIVGISYPMEIIIIAGVSASVWALLILSDYYL